jgi:hypothetical protein
MPMMLTLTPTDPTPHALLIQLLVLCSHMMQADPRLPPFKNSLHQNSPPPPNRPIKVLRHDLIYLCPALLLGMVNLAMATSVIGVQGDPNHEECDIEAEDLSLDVPASG